MKHRSLYFGLFAGFIIFAAGIFIIARIYSHPIALAQKIAEVDCVIATNRNEAFSITVTGENAKNIARAIGLANRGPLFAKSACSPFLRLEFYKGTNCLATVDTCGKMFWVEHAEYLDQTGVLETLMNDYLQAAQKRRETQPHEFPRTNGAAVFTNSP